MKSGYKINFFFISDILYILNVWLDRDWIYPIIFLFFLNGNIETKRNI